jgi:hypothetical protein
LHFFAMFSLHLDFSLSQSMFRQPVAYCFV